MKSFKYYIIALRPLHWFKNVLIFAPLLIAHRFFQDGVNLKSICIFIGMCSVASAGYLINDLFDVESDRSSLQKKNRPYANNKIPAKRLIALATLMFSFSIMLAAQFSFNVTSLFILYFISTVTYSAGAKKFLIIDILLIVYFYILRIIIGLLTFDLPLSEWLLSFSFFFFLGLACLKRAIELRLLGSRGLKTNLRRAYHVENEAVIRAVGISSGICAVAVLALYINSETVLKLYSHPLRLLMLCPVVLFWNMRLWFFYRRNQISDDPVAFVMRDWISYSCCLVVLFTLHVAV